MDQTGVKNKSYSESEYLLEEINDEVTMDEAAAIFKKTMADEDGITAADYGSEEATLAMLRKLPSFVIRRSENGEVVATFFVKDAPLLRSNKALYGSQYLIVKPEARGKRVGTYILLDVIPKIHEQLGYAGLLARTAIVANGQIKSALRTKVKVLGVVPNSVYFSKYGWVEDLVGIISPVDGKEFPVDQRDLAIPPLNPSNSMMTFANNEIQPKLDFPSLKYKDVEMIVEQPVPNEVFEVEEMIREAAREGHGFALDEFNSDGFMNRQLLHKSQMVVVKDKAGSVKAGVIFGRTKIARDMNTTQGGGYIVVNKDVRGQGLGKSILSYCLDNISRLGYTAILADVFTNNRPALAMLENEGFIITATVPNSGFLKGNGRTNTYIMYKEMANIK